MQKVRVEVKCHERVGQLSEPTFNQACNGVDDIVVQTRWLRSCANRHFRLQYQNDHKMMVHFNWFTNLIWLKQGLWQHFFFVFTCLKNLVQLLCSTRWARLPVKSLGVKAVYLHMHQQHLNHFGHWVDFTGEHVHLNSEVKWSRCTFILLQTRQEKEGWQTYWWQVLKTCQWLWTHHVTQWYL